MAGPRTCPRPECMTELSQPSPPGPPLATPAPSRRPAAPRPEYVALATVLVGLTVLAATGAVTLPLRDFEEYWSAGEVFVHGGNAYDARELDESLRAARGEADV